MNQNPDFDDRLDKARQREGLATQDSQKTDPDTQTSLAGGLRIGMEFAAGVGVGLALGIVLDKFLGCAPLFTLLFLFFGFGAGLLNVYRSVNNMDDTIGLNRRNASLGDKPDSPKK